MSVLLYCQDALLLESKYENVTVKLNKKYNETTNTKQRAEKLKKSATELFETISKKMSKLNGEFYLTLMMHNYINFK